MGKFKGNVVTFEEVFAWIKKMDLLLDAIMHGETLSKLKSEKLLAEYRTELSKMAKMISGARRHSIDMRNKLVPKKVLESEQNDTMMEKKVDIPDA